MTLPALLAALAILQTPATVIPDQPLLDETIAARDTALFSVMFDQCDPAALADLVTDDLEFYHDQAGLIATRAAFVEDYRRGCEARKTPDAFRSRRELVAGSMRVYAIPGIGAVEEGSHVFYERQGDGPEKLVGRARFSVLWKLDDGVWRLSRAFSIDHAAAE
ncbi:nuclear transport factor 2 family protein [Brevundimonas sp.]|uniref:nuclear transport factor 2 family protein n=1 Tax=Brevundimonas sp. TaxID=1871086 RepID=UPI002BC96B98|nr:nuclear transport factor 2 family protein [Brevundimonas sp.]HWQ86467.1 nuclear transport factor 2 family protein [Brevundimonas sp.]